jgi:hypothetical protein
MELYPCAKEVIFITEFALLCRNPPYYEVKKIFQKGFAHGGISKIIFLDHFSPSFLGKK